MRQGSENRLAVPVACSVQGLTAALVAVAGAGAGGAAELEAIGAQDRVAERVAFRLAAIVTIQFRPFILFVHSVAYEARWFTQPRRKCGCN